MRIVLRRVVRANLNLLRRVQTLNQGGGTTMRKVFRPIIRPNPTLLNRVPQSAAPSQQRG